MCLIVLWVIREHVRIDIESFQVVPIDDASDWFICVCTSITLGCCFVEIVLKFRVGHSSSIGS